MTLVLCSCNCRSDFPTFGTRIDEHFGKNKKSKDCLEKCSKNCFSVLDVANTKHQLRIKEPLYITSLSF